MVYKISLKYQLNTNYPNSTQISMIKIPYFSTISNRKIPIFISHFLNPTILYY